MSEKNKIGRFKLNRNSFNLSYFFYRLEEFYSSAFGKIILSAVFVAVGFLIAYAVTKRYLGDMSFEWWVKPIMYIFSIALSLLTLRSLTKGDNRVARATACVVILFAFFTFGAPMLNIRNFDEQGNPLKWINSVNKEVYNKPLAAVLVDAVGKEYFLHPQTADTCRRATKEDLYPSYNSQTTERARYITVYDTLFRKQFSRQGQYSSGIYWGDIECGDIVEIRLLNSTGMAKFLVSPNESILVSSNNEKSSYSLQVEAPEGKENFKYYIELFDGAKIEVLRMRKVVRRFAT
ncbi:hypothetical protein EOL94_00420 [bacterium]|nr:hypothetical protein [bacterium]